MDTIKIRGKEYWLKYTLRNYLVYEQITGTPFVSGKLLNVITLLYCVLLANNDSFKMQFKDFMDALDEDDTIIQTFSKWLNGEVEKRKLLTPDQPEEIDKKVNKKKVSQ